MPIIFKLYGHYFTNRWQLKLCKLSIGIKYILIISMAMKFYNQGLRDITFQIVCVVGINLKSKVIIIALIISNGDVMAVKVLINGLFIPMNLPNYLFMAISFKLMIIIIY